MSEEEKPPETAEPPAPKEKELEKFSFKGTEREFSDWLRNGTSWPMDESRARPETKELAGYLDTRHTGFDQSEWADAEATRLTAYANDWNGLGKEYVSEPDESGKAPSATLRLARLVREHPENERAKVCMAYTFLNKASDLQDRIDRGVATDKEKSDYEKSRSSAIHLLQAVPENPCAQLMLGDLAAAGSYHEDGMSDDDVAFKYYGLAANDRIGADGIAISGSGEERARYEYGMRLKAKGDATADTFLNGNKYAQSRSWDISDLIPQADSSDLINKVLSDIAAVDESYIEEGDKAAIKEKIYNEVLNDSLTNPDTPYKFDNGVPWAAILGKLGIKDKAEFEAAANDLGLGDLVNMARLHAAGTGQYSRASNLTDYLGNKDLLKQRMDENYIEGEAEVAPYRECLNRDMFSRLYDNDAIFGGSMTSTSYIAHPLKSAKDLQGVLDNCFLADEDRQAWAAMYLGKLLYPRMTDKYAKAGQRPYADDWKGRKSSDHCQYLATLISAALDDPLIDVSKIKTEDQLDNLIRARSVTPSTLMKVLQDYYQGDYNHNPAVGVFLAEARSLGWNDVPFQFNQKTPQGEVNTNPSEAGADIEDQNRVSQGKSKAEWAEKERKDKRYRRPTDFSAATVKDRGQAMSYFQELQELMERSPGSWPYLVPEIRTFVNKIASTPKALPDAYALRDIEKETEDTRQLTDDDRKNGNQIALRRKMEACEAEVDKWRNDREARDMYKDAADPAEMAMEFAARPKGIFKPLTAVTGAKAAIQIGEYITASKLYLAAEQMMEDEFRDAKDGDNDALTNLRNVMTGLRDLPGFLSMDEYVISGESIDDKYTGKKFWGRVTDPATGLSEWLTRDMYNDRLKNRSLKYKSAINDMIYDRALDVISRCAMYGAVLSTAVFNKLENGISALRWIRSAENLEAFDHAASAAKYLCTWDDSKRQPAEIDLGKNEKGEETKLTLDNSAAMEKIFNRVVNGWDKKNIKELISEGIIDNRIEEFGDDLEMVLAQTDMPTEYIDALVEKAKGYLNRKAEALVVEYDYNGTVSRYDKMFGANWYHRGDSFKNWEEWRNFCTARKLHASNLADKYYLAYNACSRADKALTQAEQNAKIGLDVVKEMFDFLMGNKDSRKDAVLKEFTDTARVIVNSKICDYLDEIVLGDLQKTPEDGTLRAILKDLTGVDIVPGDVFTAGDRKYSGVNEQDVVKAALMTVRAHGTPAKAKGCDKLLQRWEMNPEKYADRYRQIQVSQILRDPDIKKEYERILADPQADHYYNLITAPDAYHIGDLNRMVQTLSPKASAVKYDQDLKEASDEHDLAVRSFQEHMAELAKAIRTTPRKLEEARLRLIQKEKDLPISTQAIQKEYADALSMSGLDPGAYSLDKWDDIADELGMQMDKVQMPEQTRMYVIDLHRKWAQLAQGYADAREEWNTLLDRVEISADEFKDPSDVDCPATREEIKVAIVKIIAERAKEEEKAIEDHYSEQIERIKDRYNQVNAQSGEIALEIVSICACVAKMSELGDYRTYIKGRYPSAITASLIPMFDDMVEIYHNMEENLKKKKEEQP